MSSPKWLLPVSVPRATQCCLLLHWETLESTSVFDLGSFQITASSLGLGPCEVLDMTFKCLCFLQPSNSPIFYSCWPSKPEVLEACLPCAGCLGWEPYLGVRTLTPWEELLQLWLSSHLWVVCLVVCVLTMLCLCPSYPSHCNSFFISSCAKSFFGSVWSFS